MNVFVLSGGNASGGFQAGAIAELEDKNIYPDVIVGSSIGAWNAYIYMYGGVKELMNQWTLVNSRSRYLRLNWRKLFIDGIYDLTPGAKLLGDIRKKYGNNQQCEAYSTTVTLDGRVKHIHSKHPSYFDATIGSAAEPVFMRPWGHYTDGGTREFIPLKFAKTLGKNKIYVISTSPLLPDPDVNLKKKNLFTMLDFAVDNLTHEVALNDMRLCEKEPNTILIKPKSPLKSRMKFEQEIIAGDIIKGRNAAKEIL